MQVMVYKTKVRNVEDLRKRIVQAWNNLDQQIIDSAVREWRKRLRACYIVCNLAINFTNFIDIV